jgi:hypothetical protein
MSATNELYIWFMTSLFVLGILLIPLGLSFLFLSEKMVQLGNKLNHWISTEHWFDALNRPRYQERLFYRYHHLFGASVMLLTALCIYMMLFYADVSLVLNKLSMMADTVFGKWLLETLYYVLIAANGLAFVFGAIIFIRPSVLKNLETKANHWVETEQKLDVLNSIRDLPETVLPGNPRIFGTLILIGAVYIIVNTKDIIM